MPRPLEPNQKKLLEDLIVLGKENYSDVKVTEGYLALRDTFELVDAITKLGSLCHCANPYQVLVSQWSSEPASLLKIGLVTYP